MTPTNESAAYTSLKAALDMHEMWECLDTAAQLEVILDRFPCQDWFQPEYLTILASVRHAPPGKWGQVKAIFKTIGGNAFDLEKEVDKLIQAEHTTAPVSVAAQPAPSKPQASITTMSDVQERPVEWLWHPYLARGTIAMLDGDPGLGKSLLTLQLAASLSRGYPLPDQEGRPTLPTGSPQHVILITSEDSPEHTIKPRLLQAGGDPSRVHILNGWTDPTADDPTEVQGFDLQHLPILEEALERYPAALVVIDPLQAVLGGIDLHRSNETRPLLSKLAALARKHNVVILCVRHPAKAGEGMGKALHRGLGSVDIIGIARTALFVEGYPNDDTRAFLAQTKSNLGKKGRTLVFSKTDGVFAWEGVTRLTDENLAGSGRGPNHRAFLEGLLWLEKRLEGGLPWNASDIEAEAELNDISSDMLKRAKKALGVVSAQRKGEAHAGWTWRLPPLALFPTPPPPSDSTDPTDSTDSTDTPDLKSSTYTDTGVRGSVGPEGSEGSGVSVVGVAVGGKVAPLALNAVPRTSPCFACRGVHFWENSAGMALCVRCHPQPGAYRPGGGDGE
jgi:archaellum biogenesis ATPase FlaH